MTTRYRVRFTPRSRKHLSGIARHVKAASSPTVAESFVAEIIECCEQLSLFPERGTDRSDIGSGIRTLGFRRRVLIVFSVRHHKSQVVILGIHYGGRSEATLRRESGLPSVE